MMIPFDNNFHFLGKYRNVNLLIRRGADINFQFPRNSGYTALHEAATEGQIIKNITDCLR